MYRTTLATSLLATALLAGTVVPAQAAGLATSTAAAGTESAGNAAARYPVADALAEIAGFNTDSQAAALAEGFTTVISFASDQTQATTSTTTVDRAGNEHTVTTFGRRSLDYVSAFGVGTWIGLKSDLLGPLFRPAVVKRALQYVGRTGASHMFMADPLTPKADAETTGLASATEGFTTETIAKADKSAFGDSDGVRYRLVETATDTAVTIDVLGGRIVAVNGSGVTNTWAYGAEDLQAPGEAETVSSDELAPALEAAALPITLKAQARRIIKRAKASAQKQNRTVSAARIRHYTVSIVKKDNTDGREIRTRAKKATNGARIFARNPYTNKMVAYKIVVVRGQVQLSRA
jgi:hypothetical protein